MSPALRNSAASVRPRRLRRGRLNGMRVTHARTHDFSTGTHVLARVVVGHLRARVTAPGLNARGGSDSDLIAIDFLRRVNGYRVESRSISSIRSDEVKKSA